MVFPYVCVLVLSWALLLIVSVNSFNFPSWFKYSSSSNTHLSRKTASSKHRFLKLHSAKEDPLSEYRDIIDYDDFLRLVPNSPLDVSKSLLRAKERNFPMDLSEFANTNSIDPIEADLFAELQPPELNQEDMEQYDLEQFEIAKEEHQLKALRNGVKFEDIKELTLEDLEAENKRLETIRKKIFFELDPLEAQFRKYPVEIPTLPYVDDIFLGVVKFHDNDRIYLLPENGCYWGILPKREMVLDEDDIASVNVSEIASLGNLTTVIVGYYDRTYPVVSLRPFLQEAAWHQLRNERATDNILTVKVKSNNEFGAMVNLNGLSAFLPLTQYVDPTVRFRKGQEIKVRIIESDERYGSLIVSEKRALEEARPVLSVGSLVNCTVSNHCSYGIFMKTPDNGQALLHISQISGARVENLEEIFPVGSSFKVLVVENKHESGRISISLRSLESYPGEVLSNFTQLQENAEKSAGIFMERLKARSDAMNLMAQDLLTELTGGNALETPIPMTTLPLMNSTITTIPLDITSEQTNNPIAESIDEKDNDQEPPTPPTITNIE